MMRLFLLWIWFLLTAYTACGQVSESTYITDLQQEVKLYPSLRSILNEQSFPDYITKDSIWHQTLLKQIRVLISEKIGETNVRFADGYSPIQFIISATPLSPQLKLIDVERNQGEYFVAITNTIALTTTGVDEAELPLKLFNYVCTIRIEDKGRRPLYNHKVTIPFRIAIQPNNGIYGEAEISEMDFKQLCELAIKTVFNEQIKRLPPRTFYRPSLSNSAYTDFLAKTQAYTLQESIPDIPVQQGQPQNSRFILKEEASKKTYNIDLSQVYTGNPQNPDNMYSCRVDLQEDITQTSYQLWMHLNWPANSNKAEVPIRCMSQGLLAGDFTLNARKFEGMVGYQVYAINSISPKNTVEIVANNKLLALVQKSAAGKVNNSFTQDYVVYTDKNLPVEQQGEIITIYLIYKLAAEFGKDFL